MTLTSRNAQDSVPRWRGAVVRTGTALVTALIVGAGFVGAGVPAAAVTHAAATHAAVTQAPAPTLAAPSEAGTVELVLSPVNQGVLTAGGPLSVSVTVDNGSVLDLAPATVTLSLSPAPLPDRASLAAWLAGGQDVALEDLAATPTASVAVNDSTTLGVTVAADDPRLVSRTPGVYALRAIYAGGAGSIAATSAVIVPDPAQPASQVGVIVPITAPALDAGLLTAEQLATLTGPQGALSAQVDALIGTSAIIAVDPAIVAAIRVLGTSAPDTATAWLAAVMALPNSRFALQFGDADVSVQMDAGLPQPLQPLELQPYMAAENFVPQAPVSTPGATTAPTPSPTTPSPPTPSPTATPGATTAPTDPVFPDLAALQDVNAMAGTFFWPIGGSASGTVVDALGALSSDANPAITLIPSTSTEQGASGATVAARGATGTGAAVLVYDAAISAALQRASDSDVSTARGAALTEATALLMFAKNDAGGAPLLVTLDRPETAPQADAADSTRAPTAAASASPAASENRSRVGIGTAVAAIDDAPGTDLAALGAVVGAAPSPVTVVNVAADPARVGAVMPLIDDEARLTDFATILDTPAELTSPERASMLQLLGAAWASTPAGWTETYAAHRAQTAETLAAVSIQPPSTIQLLSPGADLRFWVRNELQYPVNVELFAEPNNLRLEVQDRTLLTATADSNTAVTLPVEARVGNGDVSLSLQLKTPTGVLIGPAESADVTVRADWEAIGLTIMAVLVGGLLVVGIVRTLLRRRRSNPAVDADGPDDARAPHANSAAPNSTPPQSTTPKSTAPKSTGKSDE